MKGSLIIVGFFLLGLLVGNLDFVPKELYSSHVGMVVLCVLMFLVGISLGTSKGLWKSIKETKAVVLLVPGATIVGTLVGTAIIGLFLKDWTIYETMAVGSGFGYYSLSSVFISEYKGASLGTIALISNVLRELIALLAAPFLVRYFGKLAPISAAGATSMDTCLPIITRVSGNDFVLIAILHGIIVDLSVPFLVTAFCSI